MKLLWLIKMPTSSWKSANYDLNLASCSHNLISPQCYLLLNAAAVFFSSIFFFVFFVLGSTRGRKANMVWGKPPASTGMTLLLRHDVQKVKQGQGTWLTRLVHVWKICESKTLKQEHENKIWNPTVFFFLCPNNMCRPDMDNSTSSKCGKHH